MADSRERPGADAPGTFTALLEEVVRGAGPAADAWASGFAAGDVVGRYELLREIGRGGSGVVFEARDRELGRTVAFKALRATGEATRERRLLAEAEVAARLSHPNIVTVLDVGRGDRGVYLVQEYLTGTTLAERLAAGAVPLREALRIGIELTRGLAHAHAHGVVHRDLAPRNVQLCDDGQVKLLDLGMAAALGRRKIEGGTPAYMAPEQASGAPEDERTDVWALGALIFRMLTGVAPVAVDANGRQRSSPRGLAVPDAPALAELVEAMLAEDSTARPRDASDVLAALEDVAQSLPRTASTGKRRAHVRPAGRTRWLVAGLGAGVAAAVVVAVPLMLWVGMPTAGANAGGSASRVVAATSRSRPCTWAAGSFPHRHDFDVLPPGARFRHGEFGGQELTRRDGRGAWLQHSDWNQLIVPISKPLQDVFAIEASLWVPGDAVLPVAASLQVFTDPAGPMDDSSSRMLGGRMLEVSQDAGAGPVFRWWRRDVDGVLKTVHGGNLAGPFTGAWHVLRIEGSRSAGWLRGYLDGIPLVVEFGVTDLSGGHVMLQSNGAPYTRTDVLWRALEMDQGSEDCR